MVQQQNWDSGYKQTPSSFGESPALLARLHSHSPYGTCAAHTPLTPGLTGSCNHKLKASYWSGNWHRDLSAMLKPLLNPVQAIGT